MVYWDEVVIKGFSILTILTQIVIALAIVELFVRKYTGKRYAERIWSYLGKKSLFYIFLISLVSMLGSLTFSEILHFAPCTLCWYQRILMYPIAFLSGMALIRKDKRILPYLLMLSIIGFAFAGFHYVNQISETPINLPCSALGYSASCSESFFTEYGYITIPMMAFTAFAGIIVLYLLRRVKED